MSAIICKKHNHEIPTRLMSVCIVCKIHHTLDCGERNRDGIEHFDVGKGECRCNCHGTVQDNPKPFDIYTGFIVPVTGYYRYSGHLKDKFDKCFIPVQSYNMFFKRSEVFPKLGNCGHNVRWTFIRSMKNE